MNHLISNKDIIKKNFLKFYNDATFYIIKIFSRKKDAAALLFYKNIKS